jgi:hypothetical protein
MARAGLSACAQGECMNKISVELPLADFRLDKLGVGEFAQIIQPGGKLDNHIVLRTAANDASADYGPIVDLTNYAAIIPEFDLWEITGVKLQRGTRLVIEVGQRVNLSYLQVQEVREILKGGNKINAIKRVRELTNAGLKEAKDYVESLEN